MGGTLYVMDGFDANAFVELVKKERLPIRSSFPHSLVYSVFRKSSKNCFSSLKTVLSAGSPLRLDIKENILSRISENLYELCSFLRF